MMGLRHGVNAEREENSWNGIVERIYSDPYYVERGGRGT